MKAGIFAAIKRSGHEDRQAKPFFVLQYRVHDRVLMFSFILSPSLSLYPLSTVISLLEHRAITVFS